MPAEQDPDPAHVRLLVTEISVPGVLLGHQPTLPEPADPEVGWTTTDDAWE